MDADAIAQYVTVVGGALVGLVVMWRKLKTEQVEEAAKAEAGKVERQAAEQTGIDQAVEAMKWLVDSLKDRIDQQDEKLDEQDRQLTSQAKQLGAQSRRIDQQGTQITALESDQRGMTGYIDRLHEWVNAALQKIRTIGDTGDLPAPPAIPESLKPKLSQPWNREH